MNDRFSCEGYLIAMMNRVYPKYNYDTILLKKRGHLFL